MGLKLEIEFEMFWDLKYEMWEFSSNVTVIFVEVWALGDGFIVGPNLSFI